MRHDNTPAPNKTCGDGAWIYGPADEPDYSEAFEAWCDRAQVVIALREILDAGEITQDDMIDLASFGAVSAFTCVQHSEAEAEVHAAKRPFPHAEFRLRDQLWHNFHREYAAKYERDYEPY
jgi:hypothetical protein